MRMVCYNPITVWQKNAIPRNVKDNEEELKKWRKIYFHEIPNGKKLKIPCGKCIGCVLDNASNWATRMYLEAKNHEENCFITLTYNDKNLPRAPNGQPTLVKRDMTLFLKKLRKAIYPTKIKFLYAGEYGSKNLRSHYHLIIFGWKPKDLKFYKNSPGSNEPLWTSKFVNDIWEKGFTPIGTFTYESACYVARYVQKKAFKEWKKPKRIDVQEIDEKTGEIKIKSKIYRDPNLPIPEFINMSRRPGIAKTNWDKNQKNMIMGIPVKTKNGVSVKKLPRYFKKLWESADWEKLHFWKYEKEKEAKKIQENIEKNLNYDQAKIKMPETFYKNTTENITKSNACKLKRYI